MKAIIPSSGNGTRMRPLTHSRPKELVEINNKPLIHHAVVECIKSKIDEIVIVIKKDKTSIEEYFNELKKSKGDHTDFLSNKLLNNEVEISFVIQEEANGSGGAILAAKEIIKDDDLVIIFPDVYVEEENPNILDMLNLSEKHDCSVIMVDSINKNEIDRYGVTINTGKYSDHYFIEEIIEKPSFIPHSDVFHGIIGRYVLKNEIISVLETLDKNVKNEIDLTQGLITLEKKIAKVITGKHFECGSIDSYKESLRTIERKGSSE
jgi:UTP--glucose-1-phosphate uridylyltransferase